MSNPTAPSLCLIEDDEIMGESLLDRFELEGYAVDWHRTAQSALAAVGSKDYAAVVSDIRLRDGSGEEIFIRLLERGISLPPFLFITGHGSIDRAVALLKLGAADYVTKPFDLDQLVEKVGALCGNRVSPCEGDSCRLGISPAMRQIAQTLPRLAQHASTILITGESGVGKEVIAHKIHQIDPRTTERPFVAINCGAISESLLEPELFGHEKGAFTGAIRARKGVFEQADGGTLFLDEIGELSLPAQAKLLRFLESGEIHPVGAARPIPVRTRLIAATHRDLPMLVAQQLFRADLYYRLQVVPLEMPALRERADDVLELFSHFARLAAARHGRELISLDRPALRQLQRYPWPGNVRELKNLAERLTILHGSDPMPLGLACLPAELRISGRTPRSTGSPLVDAERQMLADALSQAQGNRSQAARLLGISRDTLVYRIRKYELA